MSAEVEEEQMTSRASRLPAWFWEAAALLALLLLYMVTANPHLAGADSGEFVLLSFLPGRAHPSGYPLYVLYLRWISPLFFWAKGEAHAAALATGLVGFGACVGIWRAALGWGAGRMASMIAACCFAVSGQVWLLHVHAEAFALNNMLCAWILWFAAPGAGVRGTWRVGALGLLAGLALSNHHSCVLVAPVGLYGVWLGCKETRRVLPALASGVFALALGLASYLTLLEVESCRYCMVWGDVNDLGGLLDHFLRREYGTFQLSGKGEGTGPLEHWALLALSLLVDFAIFPTLLAAWGVTIMRQQVERAAFYAWFGAFLLCGPLFVAVFDLEPVGALLEIVRRFHALPALFVAIALAFGLQHVFSRYKLAHRDQALLGFGVVLLLVLMNASRLESHHNAVVEAFGEDVVSLVPDGGVLFGSGDAKFLSVQLALATSDPPRDIDFINPNLLRFDWYRARVAPLLGVAPEALDGLESEELLAIARKERGRVYWMNPPEVFLEKSLGTPLGPLLLFDPRGARSCQELITRQARVMASLELSPIVRDPSMSAWSLDAYDDYIRAWLSLASVCERQGDEDGAAKAREAAERLAGGDAR